MRNGLHAIRQHSRINPRFAGLAVLAAGVLMLGSMAYAASESSSAAAEPAKPPGQQARLLPADVQALREQIQGMQKELTDLIAVTPVPGNPLDPVVPAPLPPFDEQTQQLTQQREELARVVQQLQMQLQQVQAGREDERRKLQEEAQHLPAAYARS